MASIVVHSQTDPLTGKTAVPGDKSISHRAVMLASLAEGRSIIRYWLAAGDTMATLEAFEALGVKISAVKLSLHAWELEIEGQGLAGLSPPSHPLDCRNAGTCMRLTAGILAGQRFPSILDGSPQLRRRPMTRIIEPLRRMGANIDGRDSKAPLSIRPGSLKGIEYELPVASAQVKSAILLAGLYASGRVTVIQPGPARDHTERMLEAMGLSLEQRGNVISIPESRVRRNHLEPLEMTVPGDISSAAFLLVAAATIPHSRIELTDVGLNPTRTGLLDILTKMGARFTMKNRRDSGGEPIADLAVEFDEMHSTTVTGKQVVRAIDEFPIWAVAGTQAAGESTLSQAAELRLKEVDRISLLANELRKMGANIKEFEDGMTIQGPTRLHGASVSSHGDHRLGMALTIAGLVATGETYISDADCITDSFPGFIATMNKLGAHIEWRE